MKRNNDSLKFKRLDWYIIKKFLGTYLFMIALIISIAVVFDINEKIDKFMTHSATLHGIIFDYYLNFIPYYTNLFSPLFVFLAVIFFTSKMAGNSEIIAILSNGISFKRLMKPYMISALVIAIFTFIFGSYLIPPRQRDADQVRAELRGPEEKENGRPGCSVQGGSGYHRLL